MVTEIASALGRILVTRPAGDASDMLCAALKMDGYEVFSQPLLVLKRVLALSVGIWLQAFLTYRMSRLLLHALVKPVTCCPT